MAAVDRSAAQQTALTGAESPLSCAPKSDTAPQSLFAAVARLLDAAARGAPRRGAPTARRRLLHPAPGTMLMAPAGKPASCAIWPSASAVRQASSAGLSTQQLPMAHAARTERPMICIAQFQRTMWPVTPCGSGSGHGGIDVGGMAPCNPGQRVAIAGVDQRQGLAAGTGAPMAVDQDPGGIKTHGVRDGLAVWSGGVVFWPRPAGHAASSTA